MHFRDTGDIKRRIKHREDMFLRRLFGMFAKMAKSDRKVDAWEVHAAEKAFDRFPRAAARRKFCVRVFNEARNSRISLAKMAWDFANKWATPEECLAAYEVLWDIACATGVLKPPHKSNLEFVCKFLNLPKEYFSIFYRRRLGTFREWSQQDEMREREYARRREAARRAEADRMAEERRQREARQRKEEADREAARARDYQKRMWDWFHANFNDAPRQPPRKVSPLQAEYDLLGCPADATDEAARNAYRMTAKKYHPDILRAGGMPEAEVSKASAMMAKVNEAWEKIRKARGI